MHDLKPEQAQAFMMAIKTRSRTGVRDRAIFQLMYRAGLRVAEVCALRPGDLLTDHGEVRVINGKGGKDRVVWFNDETGNWLRRWNGIRNGDCEWFFHTCKGAIVRDYVSHIGSQLSTQTIRKACKRYARIAGIADQKVTPHVFRHSYATDLMRQGTHLRRIQELLGHSNVATTQLYTHLYNEEAKNESQRLVG